MVYPQINGTLAGQNLAYFLVYANSVTHELFGLLMVVAFFIVVLLGSIFAQYRYTSMMKFETSLLASSFATLGFAVILEQYSGILNPIYFFFLVGITIISIIWVAMGGE